MIETERLVLRKMSVEDAAFILELLNEPAFLRFIGDKKVRTLDDARQYILTGPIESYARVGFGLYLVELRDTHTPVGICGLLKRETLDDVDIGFAFCERFWSMGYAMEAAIEAIAYGRNVLKLNRIVAVVSPDNARSIGLLGKLGFTFERMIQWPNQASEAALYSVDTTMSFTPS